MVGLFLLWLENAGSRSRVYPPICLERDMIGTFYNYLLNTSQFILKAANHIKHNSWFMKEMTINTLRDALTNERRHKHCKDANSPTVLNRV